MRGPHLALDLEDLVLTATEQHETLQIEARDTCRQISLPMEPPAPVTSTVRPSRNVAISASSNSTVSRPRRSSGAHVANLLEVDGSL